MSEAASPRTAFVLAGGGSLGAIQVGMLRALVAHGVRADFVVGSSVGALNGAYFAADPSSDGVGRLEAIWCSLTRRHVFPVNLGRLAGIVAGTASVVDPRGLRALIAERLPYRNLEDAAIPVHVAATNLMDGTPVMLSSGAAADAVLASCAIPAAFPPVRIDGAHLVDGAIASNTPVIAAVELGAQRLVVLPTGYACALPAPPKTALASALHALNLLIARQLVRDLEQLADRVDVATVPPLCPLEVSPYDFSHSAELIERAAESTRRWLADAGLDRQRIPGALRPHAD